MTSRNRGYLFALIVASASGLTSFPAHAQDDPAAELDPLAQATAQVAPGLALAREQTAAGDLIGAAATLERILLAHPDADEARLMHAGLLCRLDDPAGARAEIDQFAGRPVSDRARADLVAACGAIELPLIGEATG